MNGLDPISATTLATRVDNVLSAVSGNIGSASQTSAAQEASAVPTPAAGAGSAAPTPANSAETTLSTTALTLDAILRLDTSLLGNVGAQQQTTLLATPPSPASSLAANLAAGANTNGAQTSANGTDTPGNLATLLGGNDAGAAGTGAAASLATLTGINSGDPLANALATALQQAVGNSGLFYESHLAQWLAGTRSSDSLQSEPQAQLNTNTPTQSAAAPMQSASAANNKLTASLLNLLNPGGTPASQAGGTPIAAGAGAMLAGAKPGADQAGLPIHPDTVALVRQQLDVLSTSQFQWNGQAWPGTPMNLEIARRNADNGSGSGDPADKQVWHTRITLELPGLGKVDAQLSLNAQQLTARISANAQSAATMADSSVDLRRRTAAAGLDLFSLQIRQAGANHDHDGDTQPAVASAAGAA